MPDSRFDNTVKLFLLLVSAAFLGAALFHGAIVLVQEDEEIPEPVVPKGFDPSKIEPTMGQR